MMQYINSNFPFFFSFFWHHKIGKDIVLCLSAVMKLENVFLFRFIFFAKYERFLDLAKYTSLCPFFDSTS